MRPLGQEPAARVSGSANCGARAHSNSAEDEEERPARGWPMRPASDLVPQRTFAEIQRDETLGWEP